MGRNENTNRHENRNDNAAQTQLEQVRQKCIRQIEAAVAMAPNVLGKADVKAYEKDVISDEAFAASGVHDTAEKIRMIKQNINVHIPALVSESRALETRFREKIQEAKSKGWINDKSVRQWLQRLQSGNVYYYQKKKFIEDPEKFPKYLKNWQRVAEAREKLLKHPQVKRLKSSDVPQIAVFLNQNQFLNLSFEAREALLATVTGALAAKEKHVPTLFVQARAMLEGAARNQSLSWTKVGSWLQRIFTSSADPDQIEKFLNNKGSMPLQKLIENWSQASRHFHKIEAKRKSLGTPPGFHFVHMNVFLNWHFDRRQAYLNEAEHRFVDIGKEPGIFLQIRHELGANDWDSAEDLIEDAKRQEWNPEDQRKLHTMELFLKFHRHEDAKKAQERPSDAEIISEMHFLIGQLPPQLQRTYSHALSRGYQAFWVLTTLMYNRVWCHQHNFLDTGKEKRIEQKATTETRERLKKGHTKYGFEANVIKGNTNTRPAVRDQAGVKGAQVLYTDERSEHTLVDEINEQKNDRNFWYWTSMIPQGVEYSHHLQIVQTLHPRMKKLARLMDQRGIRTSISGEMTSKPVENAYARAA